MVFTPSLHDYETFGANTRLDVRQFAAIRTDAELNEIGEPLMMYRQPANDYLPDPQSCLITGITPSCAWKRRAEREFAAASRPSLQPGTIGVGYNTIRFDDEITRFMFWRNLIDPYARVAKPVRPLGPAGRGAATYALRPDGITWPKKEDGVTPSFKLEHLSKANGLQHDAAHDALSDVRATIALARLIRQHNPKLFDFALSCTRRTAWRPSCACPPRRSRRGRFACVGHVPGRARLPGGDVAAGQPPHQQERADRRDPAADPRELATLNVEDIRLRMFTRRQTCPRASRACPSRPST